MKSAKKKLKSPKKEKEGMLKVNATFEQVMAASMSNLFTPLLVFLMVIVQWLHQQELGK